MELTFQGDQCLRLRGKDINVVLDPPAKIPSRLQSEIVVRTTGVTDSESLRPHGDEAQLVAGPGEFEVKGVAVHGLPAGNTTVMLVTVDEVRVVAIGNLERQLTEDEIEDLGHVDVLCLPLGASGTLTPIDATKLARSVEPSIVVPLAASVDGSEVATFAKEMGVAEGWTAQPKLNLTGSMPASDEIRVVILEARS